MASEWLLDKLNLIRWKLQSAAHGLDISHVLFAILVIAATALVADYAHMLYLRSRMPPGPFPLPIIGNTFLLPKNKPWIYFEELSKQFNTPLITFWIGRWVLFPLFSLPQSFSHNQLLIW